MGKVIEMPGAATLPVAQPRPSKPASRGGPTATWREVLEWGGWTERERAALALAKAAGGAKISMNLGGRIAYLEGYTARHNASIGDEGVKPPTGSQ